MLLLEFPDRASAELFHTSPAYREIMPLRQDHSIGTVMVVEGGV